MIYVLDTETTGLRGCPDDHVVDIGVAYLNTSTGEVKGVFSSIVGYDVSLWDISHKDAWIFNNTDLTLEQVANAPDQDSVREGLIDVIGDRNVTSYNTAFDFGKFLFKEPWDLCPFISEYPDIMIKAASFCKIPGRFGDYKWPKLDHAYSVLCPDDPANIHGKQDHRALSDAVVASYVLKSLIEKGLYPEFIS
jgi:DNA polymerase III alpha subunit (gram-positive type)